MQEFSGKTAEVTGAASALGPGLSDALAREGMNVVLADVEEEPLARAKAEFAELNVRLTRPATTREPPSDAAGEIG